MATQLPSFATVEELSQWLTEPISETEDVRRAELALRMASVAVRAETHRTWLDTTTDTPTVVADLPEVVWTVTLLCAARIYDTPEILTFTRFSDRVDDGQIDRSVSESGFGLYSSEKAMLASVVGSTKRGIGTIPTVRGDAPVFQDDYAWWVNGPDIPPDLEWP